MTVVAGAARAQTFALAWAVAIKLIPIVPALVTSAIATRIGPTRGQPVSSEGQLAGKPP